MQRVKMLSRLMFLMAALLAPPVSVHADSCALMDYACEWYPSGFGIEYECSGAITCDGIAECLADSCYPADYSQACSEYGSKFNGPWGYGGCV